MDSNTLKKYGSKSVPALIKLATKHFNSFIRERDKNLGCISCGKKVEQAGHYYSGGHYPALRFNPDNVQGQCLRCNHFLSGNLTHYREGLIKRIGEEKVKALDDLVAYHKRNGFKWSRIDLIYTILKYK